MGAALGVPGVLVPSAAAAGGGGGSTVIASAAGVVTVSGVAETEAYAISIDSADFPGIGDEIWVDVHGLQSTFVSGADRLNVYLDGVRLDDSGGNGASWAAGIAQPSLAHIILRRVDATSVDAYLWGFRGEGQTAIGTRNLEATGLVFPVTLSIRWQGGNAGNGFDFRGFTAVAEAA